MRTFFLLFLGISLSLSACKKTGDSPTCNTDTNPSESYELNGDMNTDLQKLADLWNEVHILSQDKSCDSEENCYYLALGETACGTATDYIIFSCSNVDYNLLSEKVHALNDFMAKTKTSYNIPDDCQAKNPPQLTCRLSVCEEI